jgi:hypothetical protein
VIEIDAEMAEWPEIRELQDKGHTLIIRDSNCDLILSGHAWRVDEVSRKYIPIAIKESRKEKYGNVKRADPKARAKPSDRTRPRKAAKKQPSADRGDVSGSEVLCD